MICEDCIHKEVCGLEGYYDEALIICAYKTELTDKIKIAIEEEFSGCDICQWDEDYDFDENDISEYEYVGNINDISKIIDEVVKEYLSDKPWQNPNNTEIKMSSSNKVVEHMKDNEPTGKDVAEFMENKYKMEI